MKEFMQTHEQIVDRYNAMKSIYNAMASGRVVSQMDSREFRVTDMRTPISHMRSKFANNGFTLKSEWFKTPTGKYIKRYWLVKAS